MPHLHRNQTPQPPVGECGVPGVHKWMRPQDMTVKIPEILVKSREHTSKELLMRNWTNLIINMINWYVNKMTFFPPEILIKVTYKACSFEEQYIKNYYDPLSLHFHGLTQNATEIMLQNGKSRYSLWILNPSVPQHVPHNETALQQWGPPAWMQEACHPLCSKCLLCCSVSWWEGGYPIQSWMRGYPIPGPGGGVVPHPGMGYPLSPE